MLPNKSLLGKKYSLRQVHPEALKACVPHVHLRVCGFTGPGTCIPNVARGTHAGLSLLVLSLRKHVFVFSTTDLNVSRVFE